MFGLLRIPSFILVLTFVTLRLSEWIGAFVLGKRRELKEDERGDFSIVVAASLTLLGLIIGFTFSMAVSRYEQRKSCEEAEANAIGTEYLRADFLPAADAAKVRDLLKKYLNQRFLFYQTRDESKLQQIDLDTSRLQSDLWSTVQPLAAAQQTAISGLVISGMNDVLNSQGYTQAAWWNRIPPAAWGLMSLIAACSSLLIGYVSRRASANKILFFVTPFLVSISFFLISDIDSPRRGLIRVQPQNLEALSRNLNGE